MGELQDKIVAEARTWVGTRWGHQKMTKGVRCDCAGLVRGVVETVTGEQYEGLWEYSHRPDTRYLIKMLNKYFVKIYPPPGERLANQVQSADILLFEIDGNPQHLAIKTDTGIIHAYAGGPRRVKEVPFGPPWVVRLVGVWRISEGK